MDYELVQRIVLFASILFTDPTIFHAHVRMSSSKKISIPTLRMVIENSKGVGVLKAKLMK